VSADEQLIRIQFDELAQEFSLLQLEKNEEDQWCLRGTLGFIGNYAGQILKDHYEVLIVIPDDYPFVLPQVWETGKRIPKDFHTNYDGSACVGWSLATIETFRQEPSLIGFIRNCVVPYLYSYSFYSKYGKMPYGELSHGVQGIYEYYSGLFKISDQSIIRKFLKILAETEYHGDLPCPCGSGKKLNFCHGPIVQRVRWLQPSYDFKNEYNYLLKNL